jgi:hypothetical protein
MNESFDAARLRREDLDHEIESVRIERLLHAMDPRHAGVATRARAALGRAFVSLGTAMIGGAGAASAAARSAGSVGSSGSAGSGNHA